MITTNLESSNMFVQGCHLYGNLWPFICFKDTSSSRPLMREGVVRLFAGEVSHGKSLYDRDSGFLTRPLFPSHEMSWKSDTPYSLQHQGNQFMLLSS